MNRKDTPSPNTISPQSGEGVHNWLIRAAMSLLRCETPPDEVFRTLQKETRTCGRTVTTREINNAISNGARFIADSDDGTKSPSPRWPKPDRRLIRQICARTDAATEFERLHPVTLERPATEEIIDILIPGNPLLCCAKNSYTFATRHRDEWHNELSALQLIVPSPMTCITGRTQDGRESQHTLDNTGARRYLVIEFDSGTPDEQSALFMFLAERAPFVMALHSGGKSIHGWFPCRDLPEDRLRDFMELAVKIGADRATWSRSQFVRMPDGMRDNGRRQAVIYFNPEVLP